MTIEYHITRWRGSFQLARSQTWTQAPVARRAFAMAVYDMVKDHAALDTESGIDALLKARRTCVADLGVLGYVSVHYQSEQVMIERIDRRSKKGTTP